MLSVRIIHCWLEVLFRSNCFLHIAHDLQCGEVNSNEAEVVESAGKMFSWKSTCENIKRLT